MTARHREAPGRWAVYAGVAISWLGLVVHNVADLPGQTLLSTETLWPSLVTAGLVVAYRSGPPRPVATALFL